LAGLVVQNTFGTSPAACTLPYPDTDLDALIIL
jgi:hypothetical protein